jgi:hypothetical protein
MSTRKTLKDFLNQSGYAVVDKISFDINSTESGVNEFADEGSDLGIDPNTGKTLLGSDGILGNYLKFNIDNSTNKHKFKGGNEKAIPSNRGETLKSAHNQGVENSFIDESSHLYDDIQNYSNSGKMDDPSMITISGELDKIGETIEGTGNILKEVEGTDISQTGKVLVGRYGDKKAQLLSYQLLKNNNRFAPVNKNGAYKDNSKSIKQFESSDFADTVERVHGTQTLSNSYGAYNKNEIDGKLTLDQLKGLGASILLRAGGWDMASQPGEGIDTSIDNLENIKNEVENLASTKNTIDSTSNLKINQENIKSKNSYTAPINSSSQRAFREGRSEYASERSEAQTSLYNTELNFTSKNSNLIKYQAAAALITLFDLFNDQISVLEQYADGQSIIEGDLSVSKFYGGAGPYPYGTSKTSGNNIVDFVRKHILTNTKYPYSNCFTTGMSILFGIDNTTTNFTQVGNKSDKNFLDDSPGFWQSISYAVVRRYQSFIGNIDITSDPVHNFISFVNILRDNSILQFINVIATIGDIRLQSTGGSKNLEDGILPNDVDVLDDTPQNRIKKGRTLRGYTKLERSLNHRSLPSMYLLPGNVIKAVADMGTSFVGDNPSKGMLGSSLADKTYIDRFLTKSYNKIPIEITRKLEDQLEGEYVPFYVHDLRTNEIIAFHAFLTNLTDTISPSFDQKSGYGRLDPVQIYNSTSRSVSLTFTMISTSKEDFDEMWYKINKITTLLYPQWTQGTKLYHDDGARFVQPFSQVIGASPIVRLRVGDVIKSNYSRFNLARIHGLGDEKMKLRPISDGESVSDKISNFKQDTIDFFSDTEEYATAVFELFYALAGSPLQYKAAANDSKNKIIQGAVDVAGDMVSELLVNGFVNPLVVTQLLNVMKDPDVHEQTTILSGKKFGYRPDEGSLLASRAFLKASPGKGYSYKGKIIKTGVNYKIKVLKVLSPETVPENSQNITNSALNSITSKSSKSFQTMKRNGYQTQRTRYEVLVVDISAPKSLKEESIIVFHSDLIPDYGNIYNRRVAPLLALSNPLEAVGESIKGVAKSFASKAGISGESVDNLLGDVLSSEPAKFMDKSNNPITRAFESSMGRGLAGKLGNISFKWLEGDIPWDTDFNSRAPIGCTISFDLAVIHDLPPGLSHDGYNRAPIYNVGNIMKHVSGDPNNNIESAEFHYKGGETFIDKIIKK